MIVGEGFMLKENIKISCRCIDKALLRTIERKRREI